MVIQWSSNSRCTSLSLVWIKQRESTSSFPFLLQSWEEQRKPGCGLARRDADQPHLLQSWGSFPKLYQQQTMGLTRLVIGTTLSLPLCWQGNCHTQHAFWGWKYYWTFIMCQPLSQILGLLSWIHFVLQLPFLAHGQLFSNRSSCFNPKGSHSLWIIKIET